MYTNNMRNETFHILSMHGKKTKNLTNILHRHYPFLRKLGIKVSVC
jgi:hypothetical protein